MHKLLTGALFAALATVPAAYAQKFEVASIKRCQDSERGGRDAPSPGRIDLSCMATIISFGWPTWYFPRASRMLPRLPPSFKCRLPADPLG